MPRFVLCLACVCAVGCACGVAAAADPASPDFFETQIRPLLATNCYECHGPGKQESELRLDSREALLKGGVDGPVIVAGDPTKSKLVSAVRQSGELKMPPQPKTKLADPAIESLEAWIKAGAPWPAQPATGAANTGEAPKPFELDPAAKRHWAFQPVRMPEPPKVAGADRLRSPVDNFVLAKLEAAHIPHAPPADRRALIRRASYDLIGLPPTPEEVDAFVKDSSPHAWPKLVDRLLASPRYGERWGRYWLDVSRYSDTKGYVFMEDRKYPFAYLYRDWVIRSLNEDLPYDKFLIAQIAADQLPGKDDGSLAAMGYLTLGRRFLNNQHDIIDDRLDVIGRGMMGLTIACARCHNHKFDPIPAADYYSLYGVFSSSVEKQVPVKPGAAEKADVLEDAEHPANAHVLLRGNPGNQGPETPRQFLTLLSGPDRQPFKKGSGRLELAQAIASSDNPLTARVLVNRVWMHHFGEGLVRTVSDFGMRSDEPTHPELLDYLAARFVQEGWSLKKLHRLIMLSSAYQQSCEASAEAAASDPENRLVSRMNRRRLDFEATRDTLLAVAGDLDLKADGPSVDLLAQPFSRRRTVFGYIDRQNLPGLMRTFDFASPDTTNAQRHTTTVPQQALFLMNSPFAVEQAQRLAKRPEIASAEAPEERIGRLYMLLFGRPATTEEVQLGKDFLNGKPADGDNKLNNWERYCQALLMTNELVYVD